MKFKVEYGRHGVSGEIITAGHTIESDIDLSNIDGIVKVGTVTKDVINIAPKLIVNDSEKVNTKHIRKKSRRK